MCVESPQQSAHEHAQSARAALKPEFNHPLQDILESTRTYSVVHVGRGLGLGPRSAVACACRCRCAGGRHGGRVRRRTPYMYCVHCRHRVCVFTWRRRYQSCILQPVTAAKHDSRKSALHDGRRSRRIAERSGADERSHQAGALILVRHAPGQPNRIVNACAAAHMLDRPRRQGELRIDGHVTVSRPNRNRHILQMT